MLVEFWISDSFKYWTLQISNKCSWFLNIEQLQISNPSNIEQVLNLKPLVWNSTYLNLQKFTYLGISTKIECLILECRLKFRPKYEYRLFSWISTKILKSNSFHNFNSKILHPWKSTLKSKLLNPIAEIQSLYKFEHIISNTLKSRTI